MKIAQSIIYLTFFGCFGDNRSGDYKKVPIAIIDEKQVNGSEEILNTLLNSPYVEKILSKQWSNDTEPTMTMQQFKESENAKKWFRFAADDLGAVLYPNICGTLGDSFDAFSYVKNVDSFTGFQKMSIQYLGSLAMYFAASRVKCEWFFSEISVNRAFVSMFLITYSHTPLANVSKEKHNR